ncbi:MAG: hypothetical protein ACRYFU_13830 [Janthinobacterium lividum]
MASMSTAVKIATTHSGFSSSPGLFAGWIALRPDRRQLLAGMIFVLVVAIGSVWAVYTMQYYDDLGAEPQVSAQTTTAVVQAAH